jgi:hypothetical protein
MYYLHEVFLSLVSLLVDARQKPLERSLCRWADVMRSEVILKAAHAFLSAKVVLMLVHEAMTKDEFMAAAGQFCTHLCFLHIDCLLFPLLVI